MSSDSELTIERGDKVLVTDMSDKHRWKGTVNQKEGWFPSWVLVGKQKPSGSDSQPLAASASADDEAARSDLTISKHKLQPSQTVDPSSLEASSDQHEPPANNTQQLSFIETTTGEAENVVSLGSIDSAVCHWNSGDFVGWLKHIGFIDFHGRLGRVGVTDLSSAAAVTEQKLRKAGIKKQWRINKFLQESAKLKDGKIVSLFVERLDFLCVLQCLLEFQEDSDTDDFGPSMIAFEAYHDYKAQR